MSNQKRYVPIAEYQRQSGLSYSTVKQALETGQLRGIKTNCGKWKVDTEADKNPETIAIMQQLSGIEKAIQAICMQFNVKI